MLSCPSCVDRVVTAQASPAAMGSSQSKLPNAAVAGDPNRAGRTSMSCLSKTVKMPLLPFSPSVISNAPGGVQENPTAEHLPQGMVGWWAERS